MQTKKQLKKEIASWKAYAAKLELTIGDLKDSKRGLVDQANLLDEENTALANRVLELEKLKAEVDWKLRRATEHFGEAFVKGGELPPAKGPSRPNRPKLTDTQAYEIRTKKRFYGYTNAELASQYGVNPATIARIVNRTYHA